MDERSWIPAEIPLDKHNSARVYDYWLGGYHNFEIDRAMGDRVIAAYPDIRLAAHANRAFLRRAVEFCTSQGVDQFLDLGSGLPTVGNVHEVAQSVNPAAHVVYVDKDPVAVAHSLAILQDTPSVTAIQMDIRQPDQVLAHPEVQRLLDFDRPVTVLLLSILHAFPEDEIAYGTVQILRDALASGSYIAISHGTTEGGPEDVLRQIEQIYARSPHKLRSRAEIQRFFAGFEMVDPGLVYIPLWRPEEPDDVFLDAPERVLAFAGVGRKP